MTEYEKTQLAIANEAMKPENFSTDDLDLIFNGLTDEEIDNLQNQIEKEIGSIGSNNALNNAKYRGYIENDQAFLGDCSENKLY